MKIAILTATWHYNLWDELILLQEYKFLKAHYWEETIFTIFTYDSESSLLPKDEKIEFVPYFPNWIRKNPIKNLKYLFANYKAIKSSDLVVFWWGWLIYSEELQKSSSPLWQWNFRVKFAKFLKKKIVWLAVWISYPEKASFELTPIFSWENINVSVRDKKSAQIVKSSWAEVKLLDDPVFMMKPVKNTQDDTSEVQIIWISLRKWYLKDEEENIKQMILFLARKWYHIILMTHSLHQSDTIANDYAFLKPFAKTYNIQITKSMSETIEAYKRLDYMIWMRFHSMILSIINNIPFLALSYWVKTNELLWSFHYLYSMNPKKFTFHEFIRTFEDLEKSNKEAKFALKSKYDRIKESIFLDYKDFLNGLK